MRSTMVSILTVGLCVLTFTIPARADDSLAARCHPPTATFNIQQFADLRPSQSPASPRWTLLPKDFAQPKVPALLNFSNSAPSFANPSEPVANKPFRSAIAIPLVTAAPMGSSSTPGHGHWLALGVAGLVLAGAGAVLYSVEQSGSLCNGPNPGTGCKDVRTTGIALMAVGGGMAVVGFVMRFRH